MFRKVRSLCSFTRAIPALFAENRSKRPTTLWFAPPAALRTIGAAGSGRDIAILKRITAPTANGRAKKIRPKRTQPMRPPHPPAIPAAALTADLKTRRLQSFVHTAAAPPVRRIGTAPPATPPLLSADRPVPPALPLATANTARSKQWAILTAGFRRMRRLKRCPRRSWRRLSVPTPRIICPAFAKSPKTAANAAGTGGRFC